MQSYRDLEIYKLAHRLAVEVHRVTLSLPKYETYEVGSQIRRSSKSVPANIVEGFCRKHYQTEFARFLVFAHGSCNETLEFLDLLFETESLKEKTTYETLKNQYERLGRMLNGFIKTVKSQ